MMTKFRNSRTGVDWKSERRRFLARTCLVPLEQAKREIFSADLLLFRKRGVISVAGRGIHSHAAKAAWWGNDLFCLEVREFHGGRAVTLESQVNRRPGRIDVFRANADDRWPEYSRRGATALMRRFAGCDYGYWNVFKTALTHVPGFRFFCRPTMGDDSDRKWLRRFFGNEAFFPGNDVDRDAAFDWKNRTNRNSERDFDPDRAPFGPAGDVPFWPEEEGMDGEEDELEAGEGRGREKLSPPYCSEACSIADRLGGGVNPVEFLSDRFTEPADLARSPFYRYLFTLEP